MAAVMGRGGRGSRADWGGAELLVGVSTDGGVAWATVALSTAVAEQWSNMNAMVPATNHPGESVVGFMVL